MDLIEPQLKFSPSGIVTPPDWGLILAEGADAGTFLQGQLTNDVLLLPVGQSRFAGYCSAKGRLLASFVVLKLSNEKFLMVCHKDLLQATVKRLSMFVMRAKVKLSDATALYEMRGLLGDTADQAYSALTSAIAWQTAQQSESYFIKLHSAFQSGSPVSRILWVGLKEDAATHAFFNQNLPSVTADDWQLAEILSGICMVQAATSEAFVPQMLNYESVEGVSFKKGCYPGQEVVARSQFRGTLKRRAYIVSCPSPIQAGQEVFTSEDAEQACGTVASAAKLEASVQQTAAPWWGIVSMQISAATQALHLGDAKGPRLQVSALPYPLLEDI
jgi:folate-binding protein YgfZ